MLKAKVAQLDQLISFSDFSSSHEVRLKYPRGSLSCPLCGGTVFPRNRFGSLNHFYHQSRCSSLVGHHPESVEHDQGKMYIAHLLEKKFAGRGYRVEIEQVFKDVGKHGRQADVVLYFPGDIACDAHEVQLSPISLEELQGRMADYEAAGMNCFWWLGGKAAQKAELKAWLVDEGIQWGLISINKESRTKVLDLVDVKAFVDPLLGRILSNTETDENEQAA